MRPHALSSLKNSTKVNEMKSTISGLAARFSEPSSWAALGGLLLMVHINVDPGLLKSIGLAGAGLSGILAFFLPEK